MQFNLFTIKIVARKGFKFYIDMFRYIDNCNHLQDDRIEMTTNLL